MYHHEPVLLKEVLEWLNVKENKIYVDGTVGLGGHSSAILEASKPSGILYGFEWNEDSFKIAQERLKKYGERVKLFNKNFVFIKEILQKEGVLADGILLDLGISSFLLEGSKRGFSFQKDEPLDMRINLSINLTAKDILNNYDFVSLSNVFKKGEVPKADKFAKFICEKRKKKPFETTQDLVKAIKEFYKTSKKDLLAVIFQSLRIEVNKELENLEIALQKLPDVLKSSGRIVVISFHSLEDRIVKTSFKNDPRIKVLTKKPITPSEEEIKRNPRARSAKMRVGEKI
ncbi:Ribosomal RNA small subunit methyltransferase H [Thermodesulfobacterium geofontis OPF15]|uniref:Ribosomal RNA small subunit methyltransferase H n=1 Tax=Thermodesulfobacterium geofontis (strain OPF15) TaxID=795359 RepID=F8C5P7_THEGP|nr:Ribosomal RNA small subunit methyltransferase H [Thermodesulfobacterium geofontis OPF15]